MRTDILHRPKTGEISDVYFIFADDVFCSQIPYPVFVNLVKFYSLLYEHVLIADSFLINNGHLHRLLAEADGRTLLDAGVILFTARDDIARAGDLLDRFVQTGSLSRGVDAEALKRLLDGCDFRRALRWNTSDVAAHFEKKALESLRTLPLPEDDKKRWQEAFSGLQSRGGLTRRGIYDACGRIFPRGGTSEKLVRRQTDIVYSFILPSFLQTAAAYPDRLLADEYLSPEAVFFADGAEPAPRSSPDALYQPEDLFSRETVECDNPLFFYDVVLTRLSGEDILALRKSGAFRGYIAALRKNSPEELVSAFARYCAAAQNLIAELFSKKRAEIGDLAKKIQVCGYLGGGARNIVSFSVNFIPLIGPVAAALLDKGASAGLSRAEQAILQKSQARYEVHLLDARRSVKRMILSTSSTVLDDVREIFQINRLEQD